MTQRISEERNERGFFPCILLTYLILTLLLLFPFTPTQISIWPITSLLALLIVLTFFGCGKTFRGRPQFQFHYHGEHTVVMDEIGIEMLEQEIAKSGQEGSVEGFDEESNDQ